MELTIKIIIYIWVAIGAFIFLFGMFVKDNKGKTTLDFINDEIYNNVAFYKMETLVRTVVIFVTFVLIILFWPIYIVQKIIKDRRKNRALQKSDMAGVLPDEERKTEQ